MKERTFNHFPDTSECPICGTNEDRECFLVPIDGTNDGGCCEAQPFHVDCVKQLAQFRYNKKAGLIYAAVKLVE